MYFVLDFSISHRMGGWEMPLCFFWGSLWSWDKGKNNHNFFKTPCIEKKKWAQKWTWLRQSSATINLLLAYYYILSYNTKSSPKQCTFDVCLVQFMEPEFRARISKNWKHGKVIIWVWSNRNVKYWLTKSLSMCCRLRKNICKRIV